MATTFQPGEIVIVGEGKAARVTKCDGRYVFVTLLCCRKEEECYRVEGVQHFRAEGSFLTGKEVRTKEPVVGRHGVLIPADTKGVVVNHKVRLNHASQIESIIWVRFDDASESCFNRDATYLEWGPFA